MICQCLPYKYTERRRANLLLHISGAKFLCWYSAHWCPPYLERSASCTVFANFQGNKSRSRQKGHTTFINSSWGIFEQNMRRVIFWTMCHLSLDHEKKALLRWLETVSSIFQDLEFDGSLKPLYTCWHQHHGINKLYNHRRISCC